MSKFLLMLLSKNMKKALIPCFLLLLAVAPLKAAILEMKDGTLIQGKIHHLGDKSVLIESENGFHTYNRTDIQAISVANENELPIRADGTSPARNTGEHIEKPNSPMETPAEYTQTKGKKAHSLKGVFEVVYYTPGNINIGDVNISNFKSVADDLSFSAGLGAHLGIAERFDYAVIGGGVDIIKGPSANYGFYSANSVMYRFTAKVQAMFPLNELVSINLGAGGGFASTQMKLEYPDNGKIETARESATGPTYDVSLGLGFKQVEFGVRYLYIQADYNTKVTWDSTGIYMRVMF